MSNENLEIIEENRLISGLKTMENRGYYVCKLESDENLKIFGETDETRRNNSWQSGAVKSACDDVLARMNIASFQQINVKKRFLIFSIVLQYLTDIYRNLIIQKNVTFFPYHRICAFNF